MVSPRRRWRTQLFALSLVALGACGPGGDELEADALAANPLTLADYPIKAWDHYSALTEAQVYILAGVFQADTTVHESGGDTQ